MFIPFVMSCKTTTEAIGVGAQEVALTVLHFRKKINEKLHMLHQDHHLKHKKGKERKNNHRIEE